MGQYGSVRRARSGWCMSNHTLPEIDFSSIGPVVGEPFPAVQLPDQHGQIVDLHEARAGRQALVVFHRSASW